MNDHSQITHTHATTIVRPSPLRRSLAILTLIAYIGQPLVATAEIIAAQGVAANNRPTVDVTANGLPLVQIATPSAAGVSHNQYTTFNVDPAGAILNNAQSTALTQQAGYVNANPNLVNGSARIILNEVTSTNRSQLNGYTEVAGQQAEIIIANPNGITCNGCGFINTSRGILTTGAPVIGVGGSLDAFRVTSGDIQIGAAGLNGNNLTQLDLITRSVQVNGELWANHLNVITGSNQVDYTTLGVQIIQGQGTAPTVGIDVAQLGGMYANKIRLIGTEAGVGVNSAGTLAAQAGDFTLDTQGQITLTGKTTATANLSLNSATGIANSGNLYAQQNAQLTSTESISNSGLLTAQGNLTLNAASLNSTGTLGAGIAADGNATQASDLTLITQGQTIATGNNIAGRNISITATDINLANSLTQAADNISFGASSGAIDLSRAQTQSIAGTLTANASGTFNNSAGNLEAGKGISLSANSLNNTGGAIKNLGGNLNITTTQSIINTASNGVNGFIGSNGNLTLNTAALNNSSGKLYAFGNLSFDQASATLDNSAGEITSNGTTTLNLLSINNQGGTVLAAQNISLAIHAVNGYNGLGTVAAYGNNSLTLQGDYTHAAGNVFAANGNMTLTTPGNFINTTTLEAGGTLTIDAANIDNRSGALINANASVLTTTGGITNAGRIEGNSVETHSNSFTNNSTVMGNTLDLYANNLSNQTAAGFIGATQTVNLIIANALVNVDGAFIYSLGDINIGSSKIIDPVTDTLTGNAVSVTNSSSTIEADNVLRISANTITNKRTVVGVEWIPAGTGPSVVATPVAGGPWVDSYTTIYANQKFIAATTPEARLLSGRNMRLGGNAMGNDYSTIIAGGALTAQMSVTNNGSEFLRSTTLSGTSSYWSGVYIPQYGTCGFIKVNCQPAHMLWTYVTAPYAPAPTYAPIYGLLYTKLDLSPSVYLAAKDNKTVSTTTAGAVGSVNAPTLNTSASTITLPISGLYTIHTQPGQQYLVVTDPRFTSYQTFISSDYMLSRLSLDTTLMQKRLGDGFYEQKLVNEQIMQQTGQRYLGVYASANEQYAALLDAGVTAAQDLQLVPGIALTAQQIESLKQDIVWMEEREVTLPDGSIEHVLAPQLYLSQLSKADLSPSGSIIAANDIRIMGGDITNAGRIQGRNSNVLQANNISNTNGIIGSQGFTLLKADTDILNLSGKISGKDVSLNAGRDIINQRVSSNFTTTKTTAQTSHSIFGRIAGPSVTETVSGTALGLEAGISATKNLSMNAGRNISIIGAAIASGGNTSIAAARDLNVGVVTVTKNVNTSRYAASRSSVTQVGSSIATGGSLNLASGNNMTLTAAALDVGTEANLASGGDLTFASSKSSTQASFDTGITQHRSLDERIVGSSLSAVGNIMLSATASQSRNDLEHTNDHKEGGNRNEPYDRSVTQSRASGGNINLQSATISSANGKLAVIADNDVNITASDEKHESFTQTRIVQKGFFSSKTTVTRTNTSDTYAIGSALDGDSISIQSGKDINVIGSSIAATDYITLDAANDIAIAAGTNSYSQSNESYTKESGLLFNGGINVTLGGREQTNKFKSGGTTQSQSRSLVGSTSGNLNIKAGGDALISGSDIAAAKDINLAAHSVNINSGFDQNTTTQSQDNKQSGLTLAVTSNAASAAQTVQQMKQASGQSKDGRTQALAAATATLAVTNALSGFNVSASVTLGSSQSHSESTQESNRAIGSTVKAGGNLNISATGAGTLRQVQGDRSDITIQGSEINAGKDAILQADNKINLLAEQTTFDQTSRNTSSSSGAGVGVTAGGPGGMAGGITVSASGSRGNADGRDITNTNTVLNAGNKLTLKSGSDTNLIGATAKGKQVVADVGGNLKIQSVQNTSTYTSDSHSLGGSTTFGAGVTGNVNANQSNIDSNYASVQQQSGIKAGDGGFQINVKGNTDLKGGVIASTDKAVTNNKNTLVTATLTQSDLTNRSDYDAQSVGIGIGGNGQNGANVTPPSAVNAKGNNSSVTQSGISGANISIADEDQQQQLTGQDATTTVASIKRDVSADTDTSNAIGNDFNLQAVQAGITVTHAFTQQANTYIATKAAESTSAKKAIDEELSKPESQRNQAVIDQATQTLQDNAAWAPGGSYRQVLTAITAASSGNVTGGSNQLIQGAAVSYIQSLGATEVKKIAESLGSETARAALHGILACGGASIQESNCGSAALGASAGSVINSLIAGDSSKMTAEEKENRKNLVATLVTGIAVAAGSANVSSATNAATIETENNALFLHNGFVVARDSQDNDKVVKLNDKDARKLGIIDYEETGLGGIPVVSDKAILNLNGSTIYDLNNPQDFNALKEGTDMGYYFGDGNTQIYFQNGMKNKPEDAKATASLISAITGTPVGVIANDSHGITGDTAEYIKLPHQTKDVLNEFTYRKLNQSGVPTLIVMHSAGNNDALQALEIGGLYNHQYPNLSFYSLGSPIGNNTLNQIISNTGGNYIGQINDPRDPVTHSKIVATAMIGSTGSGIYLGASYGCGVGLVGGPLGCLAGIIAGGLAGGAAGALPTVGPSIYGLITYHPMQENYLRKPEVINTLQQWQSNNKP